MATRYFKRSDEVEVCTMSSGNRSKEIPSAPGGPHNWIEIGRGEFARLRSKIRRGSHTSKKKSNGGK